MLQVRAERPDDVKRVFAVHQAAFDRADEAELVEALRAKARPRLSLVAELDGVVVGHVFFSPVTLEAASAPACCGLAPVSVLPAHQSQGIGSRLIRASLERCAGVGWRAVFLVGSPAYYSRFGFVLAAARGFHYQNHDFDAVFQVLELEPDVLSGERGWVCFHEAFDRAGAS